MANANIPCTTVVRHSEPPDSTLATVNAIIRCEMCGDFSECVSCCLVRHARTPLHVIKVVEVLSQGFWENTTLTELGLTVHIGHQGGLCPSPASDTASPWYLAMRDGSLQATTIQPQTFATLEVWKLFGLLNARLAPDGVPR
ncbi:hypothetical protein BDZ89DRAFT_1148764 [Hymenopellis radicata]|nr:hypothetical protein BDZ89DRAFT_1148764 [Hymenopellis radicata]